MNVRRTKVCSSTGFAKSMSNGGSQGTALPPFSTLTFPAMLVSKAVPFPPPRDASTLRSHRSRPPAAHSPPIQPLLNSSTLDDLFRALTLECEQSLAAAAAAASIGEKKSKDSPTSKRTAVESNDEDYENLQTSSLSRMKRSSTLKTSIEVISPIKRHVVSITVSSKVSKPALPAAAVVLPVVETKVSRSSAEDEQTSNNNNSRRRRRRTRKRMVSSPATRSSSSSSGERPERKASTTKRSCSTDWHEHPSFSSHKATRRAPRRDVSLQHSSPLSVLLTSSSTSKSTSDFLHPCPAHRARRSRYESVMHQPSSLLDRMHQQFYRLSPTHRLSSSRVH